MEFTVAIKVKEGQMTSSPLEIFNNNIARCNADVQFDNANEYFIFNNEENFASNSAVLGPVDIHFERKVFITAFSSSLSKFKSNKGILYIINIMLVTFYIFFITKPINR